MLVVLLLIGLFAGNALAQQPDSKGTDFWLMFNENLTPPDPNLDLFITGDIATTGTVEIPGLGVSTPFSVTPGAVTTVSITSTAAVTGSDLIQDKGIHVRPGGGDGLWPQPG